MIILSLCSLSMNTASLQLPIQTVCDLFRLRGIPHTRRGKRWCSWLRHCVTSREVAGSILDGVTGIFH
jgi:hypothetical protein